jgi:hypothetical protein
MRTTFRTVITATLTVALLGISYVSKAAAQCASFSASDNEAIQPQIWQEQPQLIKASLSQVRIHNDPIVGFWKAKFVSTGSSGIPDGTVVDSPLVQWHSDGTEIMNSSRPPRDTKLLHGEYGRIPDSQVTGLIILR